MDNIKTELSAAMEPECGTGTDCDRLQRSSDSAGQESDGREEQEEYEWAARRLMPRECAKLQGFPSDWCNDIPHADSAEYKLWGNGIALPCLLPMMKAMRDILSRDER